MWEKAGRERSLSDNCHHTASLKILCFLSFSLTLAFFIEVKFFCRITGYLRGMQLAELQLFSVLSDRMAERGLITQQPQALWINAEPFWACSQKAHSIKKTIKAPRNALQGKNLAIEFIKPGKLWTNSSPRQIKQHLPEESKRICTCVWTAWICHKELHSSFSSTIIWMSLYS